MRFPVAPLALAIAFALPAQAPAQTASLPLRQSHLDASARDARFVVPLDSTSDGRWLGGAAGAPRWDVDGQWAYFTYDTVVHVTDGVAPEAPWWRVSRDGKRVEPVSRDAALRIPVNIARTRDGSRATWFTRGELRYRERGKGDRVLQVRADAITPAWSPDEREIRFTANGDLFAIDPATGEERQLTVAFTRTDPPKDSKVAAELKREQLGLFDFVRLHKLQKDSADARRRNDPAPQPFAIPRRKDETVSDLSLSPDGRYSAYIAAPKVEEVQTVFADYVNDSGVVYTRTGRAKVGAPVAASKAYVVCNDSFAIADSVKAIAIDTAGFGKAVHALSISWNRQGTHLVAEYASNDYKDRWVVLVDPETGKQLRTLHHEHDDDWILESPGVTWMTDGEHIALTAENTGWNHLYLVAMDGSHTALTHGDWEVRDAQLSHDGSTWWLTTSLVHPDETHLYTMPAAGGAMTRVDSLGEGEVTAVRAPDDRAMILRWGNPHELTDLYLVPSPGAKPVRVTKSGSDAFYKIAWPASDFVSFNDDQGKPVFARVYRPAKQAPTRPAVLEIHGAGYAQAVHKTFAGSSAHGGALYAKYLTDLGITYMVIDYRGSSGYGRDSRVSIYRDMGDHDVGSALAAIPFLRDKYHVDPTRVGLFGCSYGGFYTLMALFRHPGVFKGGVAQCAVTDWAHYNHWYTARILNGSPAEDTAAYRTSSPIQYASGLQDRLILMHGLVDNNVEYQDAVRLVQRLMELGKTFDFVTYPIEAHGWVNGMSKKDSQRRMTALWREILLNK